LRLAFRQKIQRNIGALLRNLLTQGTSPHKLALTIALGIITGILPVVWGSTLLCGILAYLFGLNQAGIQAANYLAYPLQIALFVPFYRMGAKIFPWGRSVSVEVIVKQFTSDWVGEIPLLLVATLKALGAWILIAPPGAVILYLIFLTIFARMPMINPKT
jgi:uncharacterized protein (DUF2062 family)